MDAIRYAHLIPLLPLLAFIVNISVGRRLPRKGDWVSVAAIGASFLISASILANVLSLGDPAFRYHVSFPWLTIGSLRIDGGILVDNLTAVMLVIVTGVSLLVHLFSVGYMHGDARYNRFFAYLSIFSFAMLGLVLSESLFFMYMFWELVGLASYLLIGFWFEKKSAADACKKAFVVNRIGDFGFLIGMLLLSTAAGTFSFDGVFAGVAEGRISGTLLTLAGIGIFCGAIGKSAQFPLHVWLPDAMEGPTPVSALIHAATMVAAGVYLVGRVFPIFTPDAFLFIAYIGAITLFMAGTIAIAQTDIKRVLAYSTVSQLGFMVMGLGVGGYTAGLAHLTTHAAFKACLFLGSGSVIHAVHTQDIREMGGLRRKMPITFWTFLVATLSIAGVPFFSGFYSKDMILGEALVFGLRNPQHFGLFAAALFTAGLTAFYMFRMFILTFLGEPRDSHAYDHAHESPAVIWVPLVVLASLSFAPVFSGWFGKLIVAPSLPGAVAVVEHRAHLVHLAHTVAMVLSVVVGALGIGIAFLVYFYKKVDPAKVAESMPKFYAFLLNKWYFDEMYEKAVVGATMALSRFLAWFDLHVFDALVNLVGAMGLSGGRVTGKFDDRVVDGAVNGVADATMKAGALTAVMQTGKLWHYIFVIAAGVIAIYLLKIL